MLFGMSSSFADEKLRLRHMLIIDSQAGNPYQEIREAMLAKLRLNGYEAGQNLQVKAHTIGNKPDEARRILLAAKLDKPDIIYLGGTAAATAALQVLGSPSPIPIVFTGVTDPVGVGLLKDMEEAAQGNMTGISFPVPVEARLRFVRQLLPQARKVALIYADMPQSRSYRAWVENAVRTQSDLQKLEIIFIPVAFVAGDRGDEAMANAAKREISRLNDTVDVFLAPNDQMGARPAFARMVRQNAKKPLIGLTRHDVMEGWGATATIFPLTGNVGLQAAAMVQRVLASEPISSIKPEWPQTFGMAIDLPKAREFGIRVPIQMLLMAGPNIVK